MTKNENQNEIKNRMIHIRLPEELHKRLRVHAAESDQTIQDWVVAALQSELDRRNKRRRST